MKQVEYKGKVYRSLRALCNEHGVSAPCVISRMKNGETLEEALESRNRYKMEHRAHKNYKGKEVVVNGVRYLSLSEAARAHNINTSTIQQRMKYGYTLEEAFNFDNRVKKQRAVKQKNVFTFNGKEYSSVRAFCKQNGYERQYSNIIKRLNAGEEFVEILMTLNKREPANVEFEIEGRKWTSYLEYCKHIGCVDQYANFTKLIRTGLSVEEVSKYVLKTKEIKEYK